MSRENYHVLKIQDFRNFLLGRFFGVVATQIQAVIVGWQIYKLTGDPLSLGLIGLAEVIPATFVSLFAGHLADKFNRRSIILNTFFILLFCSISLLILSMDAIEILQSKVYPFYIIISITGVARGFIGASMSSLMAQLVPRELYHSSSAWNSTGWQIASVSGPFLGGLLYNLNGPVLAYSLDVVLMFLAVTFFSFVIPKPIPEKKASETLRESLSVGFKFVFSNKMVLSALSLDMFAVLFGGAVALLPIFAADILKVGPDGLGILRAAPSVGAAVMALFLAHNPPKENAGRALLFSVAGFGISILLFGLSTNFYLSLFFLFLSGGFDSVSVVVRSTIIQAFTPDEMRGRVAAVNSIFIGSSNELGAFESGVTARLFGTVPSIVLGGCMTLLVVSVTSYLSPTLRKLNFTEVLSKKSDSTSSN
jgi:MFS family permease